MKERWQNSTFTYFKLKGSPQKSHTSLKSLKKNTISVLMKNTQEYTSTHVGKVTKNNL